MTTKTCWSDWTPPARGETDGTAKAMQYCVDAVPWGEFGRSVSEGRIRGWRKVSRGAYGRA